MFKETYTEIGTDIKDIKKSLSQTSQTNTDLISVETTDSNYQISACDTLVKDANPLSDSGF